MSRICGAQRSKLIYGIGRDRMGRDFGRTSCICRENFMHRLSARYLGVM